MSLGVFLVVGGFMLLVGHFHNLIGHSPFHFPGLSPTIAFTPHFLYTEEKHCYRFKEAYAWRK